MVWPSEAFVEPTLGDLLHLAVSSFHNFLWQSLASPVLPQMSISRGAERKSAAFFLRAGALPPAVEPFFL